MAPVAFQDADSVDEQSFKSEALNTLQQLSKALEQWETQQLLGGQYDKLGAILCIQVVHQWLTPMHLSCSIACGTQHQPMLVQTLVPTAPAFVITITCMLVRLEGLARCLQRQ